MRAAWIKFVTWTLWYGLAVYLALLYAEIELLPGIRQGDTLSGRLVIGRATVGIFLIITAFAVIHIAVRMAIGIMREPQPAGESSAMGSFPHGVTVVVGLWLSAFSIAAILGLIFALEWDGQSQDLIGALVAMAAAGLGSAVAAIVGYLRHASEQKDFALSYTPWYFARPLMGVLLGLIFFLLLKAGLLATYPNVAQDNPNVNEWGVAGIGALVGLFSKPAIEKLREVFNVLFRTEYDRDESLLKKLPVEERERIRPYLATYQPGGKRARDSGKV